MDFFTIVLRKSGNYWVALCLENGVVGQGTTKEVQLKSLKKQLSPLKKSIELKIISMMHLSQ